MIVVFELSFGRTIRLNKFLAQFYLVFYFPRSEYMTVSFFPREISEICFFETQTWEFAEFHCGPVRTSFGNTELTQLAKILLSYEMNLGERFILIVLIEYITKRLNWVSPFPFT